MDLNKTVTGMRSKKNGLFNVFLSAAHPLNGGLLTDILA